MLRCQGIQGLRILNLELCLGLEYINVGIFVLYHAVK